MVMSVAFVQRKKIESQAADTTAVIHLDALLLIFQYRFLLSGFLQMEIVFVGHL